MVERVESWLMPTQGEKGNEGHKCKRRGTRKDFSFIS